MDRLEKYVVLTRMYGGPSRDTLEIEGTVSKEHIERALREELTNQQMLILRYQKNITKVQERIANFGETVASLNEIEDYQNKMNKAQEVVNRIREQLNEEK